jgi:glutamate synthase (NADPH/NADH) large chain/glutamate synthase (ferredoxin)
MTEQKQEEPQQRSLYDARFEHDACGVGFVADISGRSRHEILQIGLSALTRMAHRGAVDADAATGDGAGVLTQIPRRLLHRVVPRANQSIGDDEPLVVGMIFLPQATDQSARAKALIQAVAHRRGFDPLGWRLVPIDRSALGQKAESTCPDIQQVLLAPPARTSSDKLECEAFLLRKEIERRLSEIGIDDCYVVSLSHRTIVYKGLLSCPQLPRFYLDLQDPRFETGFVIFHQRYSTNTFPNWFLAQPFRFVAHNGEINTISGNRRWMRARETALPSSVWRHEAENLRPLIWPKGSDSASLDNALELHVCSGRDLFQTMMMLVPEPHENVPNLDPSVRAFYEYHQFFAEPWDGPAALFFSDGVKVGGMLDRNGFRPARYVITEDGLVIVASEAGVVDFDPSLIAEKGRLGPGQMIGVDLSRGELLKNDAIKTKVATQKAYATWLRRNLVVAPSPIHQIEENAGLETDADVLRSQKTFGYSIEDFNYILGPMTAEAKIPVGSMGDDTPLAVLSSQSRLLYSYFRQQFAQVTNPPLDHLREKFVTSLTVMLGPQQDYFTERPEHARRIKLDSPILTENRMDWLRRQKHFPVAQLKAVFPAAAGAEGLEPAIDRLCQEAEDAVRSGAAILILSDRHHHQKRAPIPMLLAIGAVHHHLIRCGLRMRTSLIAETGEARETHHVACLIGYGASAVLPYLAYHSAAQAIGQQNGISVEIALSNYVSVLEEGVLKIMSKMGISVLASYHGAQIFEAIGLSERLIEKCFTGTHSPIGGIGFDELGRQVIERHEAAFSSKLALEDYGTYRFRRNGEYHAYNPDVIRALHKAMKNGDGSHFETYKQLVAERPTVTIRDLLEFKEREPIPLEEVEPIESIWERFCTPGMSHGALSREAHETLAIAMNRLKARSNSGEGGENPDRFRARPDGDSANSGIKQVASARFGVTASYLVSAQELEIKMAQGSKPGEGGQLPGHKVSDEIARLRHSVPGVTLISPPPHHDIYSIEDLAQLIYDLRQVNPAARIAVKLVAEAGVGTIAAGVAKADADVIHLSGHDGGTGASPLESIKHAGIPWEIGLAETQQVLLLNGLRRNVRLRVDGGLKTGRDVVIAAMLGADEFGFGTAALVALGCVMARQCHLNTCPVGIATQREDLRAKFPGTPEKAIRFFVSVAEEVRAILARLGVRRLDELIGRTDFLVAKSNLLSNSVKLDLAPILAQPERRPQGTKKRRHQQSLDDRVLQDAQAALERGEPLSLDYEIRNTDRTVGAGIAGEIARRYGDQGLPEGTFELHFSGTAGQSFAAFCVAGLKFVLDGEANDYVGKSLAGGQIVVRPQTGTGRASHEQVIMGNTVLYGATGGEMFAAGRAGERFAVRNSGAVAVVEGVGDHGCEYMTRGTVVVLGPTGRNFAAGMTGGVAYVFDEHDEFDVRCNLELVELGMIAEEDEEELRSLIERHFALTGSQRAEMILQSWDSARLLFRRVTPRGAKSAERAAQPQIAERFTSTRELELTTAGGA